MLNKLRTRVQDQKGFTLVELLVVMLILGLLAAIAIPAFFNQRDKANDAEAKTTAKTVQTAMETYATDNNSSYVGANLTELAAIEPTLTGAPVTLVPAPTETAYSIDVTSTTDTVFSIDRAGDGSLTYPCSVDAGGCPDLDWGGE